MTTSQDDTIRARGMDLRDYFAIHNTQPGVIEICKAAGVDADINHMIDMPMVGRVSFNTWWISLTLERQCELSAKVRYALADAMIAERSAS